MATGLFGAFNNLFKTNSAFGGAQNLVGQQAANPNQTFRNLQASNGIPQPSFMGSPDFNLGLTAYQDDYSKRLLESANNLANRPFQNYSGDRFANFSPAEQQAFNQVAGLQGGYQPALSMAQNTLGRTTDPGFLASQIAQYQNPYEQQVVDSTLRDLERQRQLQSQQLAGQAIGAKAFGGSRYGVQQAENTRNFNDTAARTIAELRNQGFNTSAALAKSGIDQQAAAANSLVQSAQTGQQLGLQGSAALEAVGKRQSDLQQQALDLAYQNFLEKRDFPLQGYALRQSALGGTPYVPVAQNVGGGSNFLGNVAGGLSTAAGLAGLLGAFK